MCPFDKGDYPDNQPYRKGNKSSEISEYGYTRKF